MKHTKKANMKPANCFSFVLDMIGERWKQFALVILMGIISFGLVDICVMKILENQRTYLQVNELFHVSPDTVYKISDANLANMTNEIQESQFEKKLAESDLWGRICTFGFFNAGAFEELSRNPEYGDMMTAAYAGTIEEEMLASIGRSAGEDMNVCFANRNALDLFGIYLPEPARPESDVAQGDQSGQSPGAVPQEDKLIPIYLGSSLQGMLEPGQVVTSVYLDISSVKNPDGISLVSYYVAGFLEPDTQMLSNYYLGDCDAAVSLNTMILICDEDVREAGYVVNSALYRNNLYSVLSPEGFAAFQYEARHLYEQYNKKLSMRTIPELIRENNTVMESLRLLIMLAVLLTLSGFLAFSTTSIISVLLRKRKLGIMLANGISHRDIHVMVILETAVRYLLSLIVAFCFMHVIYMSSTNYTYTGINHQMTYLHMHVQYALPLLVVFGIVGTIVSVFVPVQIVKRLNIMELLREN